MLQSVFLGRIFRLKSEESKVGQKKVHNENFGNQYSLVVPNSIYYEMGKACNALGKRSK